MDLLLNSTPTALWQSVIHAAEASCTVALEEDLESYLVFLLMRYTNKPELLNGAIAPKFLQGLKKLGPSSREQALQEVGDHCLLITGLFPSVADKRLVKISYFVNIGQASYIAISKKRNDLYGSLATQFVQLMDVLQSIRQYSHYHPDLMPLQAYDLWNETGSQRALAALKQYTDATPLHR